MFIDGHTVPNGTVVESDLCIIGAGAAGITIARELAKTPLRTCLLESGGFEYDSDTQSLYDGENVGFPYYALQILRLRYFGGTTNHWTGWCRPLDPIDFEDRPGVQYSGWPFSKTTLDPYYQRAQAVCQVGPYDYDVTKWTTGDRARLPMSEEQFITAVMRRSLPTARFGQIYRDEIKSGPSIKAYLNANAVEFITNQEASSVKSVRVATLQGTEFRVNAKTFILATGAIENARLLLSSQKAQYTGLGNGSDQVGRYFMEHLMVPGAMLLPSDPNISLSLYGDPSLDGVGGKGFLRVAPDVLRAEQLLNTRVLIMPGVAQELAMKNAEGILSAGMLWKAARSGRTPDNTASHVLNVISDLDKIAIYSYRRAFRAAADPISFLHQLEQAPNPESRVTLGPERDALGLQRVQLDWRFGDQERRTLRRVNELLAGQIGEAGIGRVQIVGDDQTTGWPQGLRGSWHQMGTTRMSTESKQGVVDRNCRVHGISNLFVAGSSVFPTSGTTNPTLTIVALALRLSDHIKEVIR